MTSFPTGWSLSLGASAPNSASQLHRVCPGALQVQVPEKAFKQKGGDRAGAYGVGRGQGPGQALRRPVT